MTELASLLADTAGLLRRVSVRAPEPIALRREVAALKGEAAPTLDPERTAALQKRVASLIRAQQAAHLSRRDLRDSCSTFLHPPEPPARDQEIAAGIVREVARTSRRAAFFALLDAYLDGFRPDDEGVRELARGLADLAAAWPWRSNDQWRERLVSYSLLDADRAPALIAREMLTQVGGVRSVMEASGLDIGARPKGGLAEAAFAEACRLCARMKGGEAQKAQLLLLQWARQSPGAGTFPRVWVDLVNACLIPWSADEPDDVHKTLLIEQLELLGGGDPRTAEGGSWHAVEQSSPDAYSVLLRWLTRASVMQFLEIVDRSLREPADRLMWSYRRAFWTSYLLSESGPRIEQAWVAFGADGARLARSVARETGDKSLSAFGEQEDKSGQHAALILRIGDLLVVDWSHSAKYNVWRRGEGGPKLFRKRYAAGELDSAPFKDSHSAPAHYNWQKKLAAVIEGRHFVSEKPAWRPSRV